MDKCGRQRTGKVLAERRGSWLFTHFGFSGPVAMDVSGVMTTERSFEQFDLTLDLVPDRSEAAIRAALDSERRGGGGQRVSSVLAQWVPRRLAAEIGAQTQGDCRLSELRRETMHRLMDRMKRLPMNVTGTRGFEKAEVTAGGVSLAEVNPKTMQSRIVEGLFIAV